MFVSDFICCDQPDEKLAFLEGQNSADDFEVNDSEMDASLSFLVRPTFAFWVTKFFLWAALNFIQKNNTQKTSFLVSMMPPYKLL